MSSTNFNSDIFYVFNLTFAYLFFNPFNYTINQCQERMKGKIVNHYEPYS